VRVYLDFETYSEKNLKDVGAYRYAEDSSTEILLIGFAIGAHPVRVCEPGDSALQELFDAIESGATIVAHNAPFERLICRHVGLRTGWPKIKDTQWNCTAARGRALGLPGSLEDMAIALKLMKQKNKAGSALITKYCKPAKAGRRNIKDNRDDYIAFQQYCLDDVDVAREIDRTLPELTDYERKVFLHDLNVNDRGIPVDVPLLHKAAKIIADLEAHFENESLRVAGVRATQRDKVIEWLGQHDLVLDNLQAKTVEDAMLLPDLNPVVKEFLELRYESSRVGTKKNKKMLELVCSDETIKGSFLYHSATTGRYGAKGVQVQNFGKADSDAMQDKVLHLIDTADAETFLKEFPRPLTAISKCMRGFIKATPGQRLLIADYSSIEARVLAWLANETFLLEAYEQGEDVYKKMAASIYGCTIEEVDSHKRFFGKQVILGAGYSMGPKRFRDRCKDFGVIIPASEATRIIDLYRESVPKISSYWKRVDLAAIKAVSTGQPVKAGKCVFRIEKDFLKIDLPSGRSLSFYQPRLTQTDWGTPKVEFTGFFNGKAVPEGLYGGLITQNICQAVARDLLCNGMLESEENGYSIILHCHDEAVAMVKDRIGSIGDFMDQLCRLPKWAEGLPLAAEGEETPRYKK
jgi:DNA polymerase